MSDGVDLIWDWWFICLTHLTYALLLSVEHRPQTTCLHPALSCAAASIFLQLYLYPAVHISFSRSLFHVFLGRPLSLWPCGVHCSTCLLMLSSFLLNMSKPVTFPSSCLVQYWSWAVFFFGFIYLFVDLFVIYLQQRRWLWGVGSLYWWLQWRSV